MDIDGSTQDEKQLADIAEDAALRIGNGKSSTVLHSHRGLSETSRHYDTEGKGFLSPAQQRMRSMDTKGMGHLTNEQVRLSQFQFGVVASVKVTNPHSFTSVLVRHYC